MYRKIGLGILSFLLAGGILAFMLIRVWDDLESALNYIIPIYCIPAVIICLTAWIMRGFRYKVILKNIDLKVPVLFSTACIFISQTVNLIVPARLGDLIRIVLLKHEFTATVSQGLSSLVVERFFDIITVAILGLIAVIFVLNVPSWLITLLALTLLLCIFFFLILIFTGRIESGNKYISYLLTMMAEIRNASLTPVSALIIGLSSVVIWIQDSLICASVSLMFRQEIPFFVIILAIVAGNLVKAVPLTPGGIGTYEFALAVVFELAGISPASAALIAVVDHFIKNLITLIGGAISLVYLGNWVLPELTESMKKKFTDEP